MAKTNFSGPITAGKIANTTGVLPSVDVRNTGFVTMGQSFAFDFTLLAADADSIATAASNPAGQGAGALTLTNTVDGTAASGSFVLPGNGVGSVAGDAGALAGEPGVAKVCIGSTGNDTGINFTIIGTDLFGNTQTEGAITGPNATAGTDVQSTLLYRTITSIVASGTLTGNITVGYSYIGVASQAIYQLKSNYNAYTNGETPATSNKNLANNVNIPARSRIVNWRVHIPIAFNMAGASTIGFGTTSFNNANTPTLDVDYFSVATAASLKTIATLNYADDFGTITAAQAENYADVSHSDLDAAIGNSLVGLDKEVIMFVNTAAGAAPTAGDALITVEYLQSVNNVRSN
jgi:hypothetical protein